MENKEQEEEVHVRAKDLDASVPEIIMYNHLRAFDFRLTPSLFVSVWNNFMQKDRPWCISYFYRVELGENDDQDCYRVEHYNYRSYEDLKRAHPFDFAEFEVDLRYPMPKREKAT